MEKVTCNICKFEDNGRCIKKKCKVSINKTRICKMYEEDEEKVSLIEEKLDKRNDIEVIERPDWFWDKKKYKEMVKEAAGDIIVEKAPIVAADPTHPLTGDLSRFIRSTAVDDEDE